MVSLCKKTVIQALITSRLDYGNELYLGLPEYLLKRLQVVQNLAAPLLLKLQVRVHISPRLWAVHWLPIRKRIVLKSLVLTHGVLYQSGAVYLRAKFSFHSPTQNLRSDNLLAEIPRIWKIRTGSRSLAFLDATTWSNLPFDLRAVSNQSAFF